MASSGTLSGSFGGSDGRIFTLYCYWSITSQNVSTRQSTVLLRWAVRKSSAAWKTYKMNAAWSQTVDGSGSSGTVDFDIRNVGADTDYFYRSDSVVIQHNANGTKTATISGTLDLSGTSAGVGSLSGSIVLDAIHVEPPTVDSFTLSDAGTGQSTVGAWVASKSKIQLTASATAVEAGATIANYAFYANDTLLQSSTSATYTGTNTATAGSYVFKVVVTDSYGLSAEQSLASVTVLAYANPTIQTETFRCDASGNEQRLGTYVKCKATWTIAAVGSNAVVVHKVTVNGTSTDLTNGTSVTLGNGQIQTNQVYDIAYEVTDKFGTAATQTDQVLTGKYDWDFDPAGGVAFGTYAETGKLKTTYDIETSGGMTLGTALPIASGGTGATTAALLASARVSDIIAATTEYCETANTTSNSDTEVYKEYTASGDGIVIASASTLCDATSSYGRTCARIQKNGVNYAYSLNGYGSATTYQLGASCSACMKVTQGDIIRLGGYSTKNGTKILYRNLLAIGCTLS